MAGQKLGASALLCYIHREQSDSGANLSLTVANVGTCQAVLCRDGRPVPLSKVYSLENSTEEMERVKLSKAIITEVTQPPHSFFYSRELCVLAPAQSQNVAYPSF